MRPRCLVGAGRDAREVGVSAGPGVVFGDLNHFTAKRLKGLNVTLNNRIRKEPITMPKGRRNREYQAVKHFGHGVAEIH